MTKHVSIKEIGRSQKGHSPLNLKYYASKNTLMIKNQFYK